MCVSEIRVKRIRVNQGLGVLKMIAMVLHLGLMPKTSEFPIDVLEIQFHLKCENFLDMGHSEIKSCL